MMRRRGVVHYLNIDYRHYYYQIPPPPELRKYFVVILEALTKGEPDRDFFPHGMPMGYRKACLLAQALTIAIVLFREKGEDSLGVSLEVGSETMPGVITLRWGPGAEWGAIFVLLDGVLILTESAELRDQWAARLKRNEVLVNLVRNVTHSGALGSTFTMHRRRGRRRRL